MIRTCAVSILALTAFAAAMGQEAHVTKINTPAPVDAIAPEIAALLQPIGFSVAKGDSQALCEIWLAKEWPIAPDAATSDEILYPLTPGQVVGVARYPSKATDFREQDIPAGVYVLRYGQQPVDGAHVGTSPTRDFFLLSPAAKDRDPKPLDHKTLVTTSKQTTGTEHPAILSMQRAEPAGDPLSIRHDADRELTIVRFIGKAKQGGEIKDLPVELVVVGKAAE